MANTQIGITENGTTTLATAGKYCDRNIDVNVNVAGKPTQFTNLYDPANVTIKTRLDASSSIAGSGYAFTADNETNMIVIPYHHKQGAEIELRMRGISTVRDRGAVALFAEDGVTKISHYQFSSSSYFELDYDEFGDAVIRFKGNPISLEWFNIIFNFQYPSYNSSPGTVFTGPIITINEPIGNGGYAA